MANDLALVTFITVVYNGAATLESTIKSVLDVRYPNFNYIIIDGGSTDASLSIIRKYEDVISYWISEPDKGIYDAMNKGWAIADDNSFIIYLGAGDRILRLPDMRENSAENIIYGKVWIGNSYLYNTTVDFRMRLINGVHHQALLIKKSIHKAPPFNLDFPIFSDFDFNQRLYRAGIQFKKDDTFYSYAMEGGVSSDRPKQEMLEVVNSNYGKTHVLIARAYYVLQEIKIFLSFHVKGWINLSK